MTDRRTLTPARKIEIAELRHWRAPGGGVLCLENGKVCDLGTGEPTEVDHAWQIATGGPDTDDNLRHMSREDHKRKSADDAAARRMIRRSTGANKERPKRRWPKGRPLSDPYWKKKFTGRAVRRSVDG